MDQMPDRWPARCGDDDECNLYREVRGLKIALHGDELVQDGPQGLIRDVHDLHISIHGVENDPTRPGLISQVNGLIGRATGAIWAIMAAGAMLMIMLSYMLTTLRDLDKAIIDLTKQLKSQGSITQQHEDYRVRNEERDLISTGK